MQQKIMAVIEDATGSNKLKKTPTRTDEFEVELKRMTAIQDALDRNDWALLHGANP